MPKLLKPLIRNEIWEHSEYTGKPTMHQLFFDPFVTIFVSLIAFNTTIDMPRSPQNLDILLFPTELLFWDYMNEANILCS